MLAATGERRQRFERLERRTCVRCKRSKVTAPFTFGAVMTVELCQDCRQHMLHVALLELYPPTTGVHHGRP